MWLGYMGWIAQVVYYIVSFIKALEKNKNPFNFVREKFQLS